MNLRILTNPLHRESPLEIEENGKVRKFKYTKVADAYDLADTCHMQVEESGMARFNPHVNSPLPAWILVYFRTGPWGAPYRYDEEV